MASLYLLQVSQVLLSSLREQLAVAVVAEDVHDLGEVVALVLVVADAALGDRDVVLAVLDPLLGQVALVLPGAERAGDGRGGERRPLLAVDGGPAAAGVAVDHAALGRGAGFEVVGGLVDDLLRHGDAGVAGRPQRLTCVIVTEPSSKLLPSGALT